MKKPLLILLCLISIISSVKSQNLTVTGTVTTASDSKPMPFVTVVIKGTNNAVTTDLEGKYTIKAGSSNDTLVFSFVVYKSQKDAVGNQPGIYVNQELS